MGLEEYESAEAAIKKHRLKPSDALHIGTMQTANVTTIVSEDLDFDAVDDLNRIWI